MYGPDGSEMIKQYGERVTSSETARAVSNSSKLYRYSTYLNRFGDLLEVNDDVRANFSKYGVSPRAFIASGLDYGEMALSGFLSSIAGTFAGGIAGASSFVIPPAAPVVAVSTGVIVAAVTDAGIDSFYKEVMRERMIDSIVFVYDGVNGVYDTIDNYRSDFMK